MSNMSYCRFENTDRDLSDCLNHMDDNLSSSEAKAREDLVALCREIAESYPKGYEFNVTLECEECGDEIESGELCDSYKEEVAAVTLAITKAAKQNDF